MYFLLNYFIEYSLSESKPNFRVSDFKDLHDLGVYVCSIKVYNNKTGLRDTSLVDLLQYRYPYNHELVPSMGNPREWIIAIDDSGDVVNPDRIIQYIYDDCSYIDRWPTYLRGFKRKHYGSRGPKLNNELKSYDILDYEELESNINIKYNKRRRSRLKKTNADWESHRTWGDERNWKRFRKTQYK